MTATNDANRCACAAAHSLSASRRRAAPCLLVLGAALAALVPKCPLCLAAYLSLIGIGGGLAASAYPYLRPAACALVALAAGAMWLGRRRGRPAFVRAA